MGDKEEASSTNDGGSATLGRLRNMMSRANTKILGGGTPQDPIARPVAETEREVKNLVNFTKLTVKRLVEEAADAQVRMMPVMHLRARMHASIPGPLSCMYVCTYTTPHVQMRARGGRGR